MQAELENNKATLKGLNRQKNCTYCKLIIVTITIICLSSFVRLTVSCNDCARANLRQATDDGLQFMAGRINPAIDHHHSKRLELREERPTEMLSAFAPTVAALEPLAETAFAQSTLTPSHEIEGNNGLPRHRLARSPLPQAGASAVSGAVSAGHSPKLVQWAKEAVQYYEGSTLVLTCSLANSQGADTNLKFSWFKQAKSITSGSLSGRLSIETSSDYSFLRLVDLRSSDSGAYTCVSTNSLGQEDRTTSQVIVNVKLKWLAPPANESRGNKSSVAGVGQQLEIVRAGQSVAFECNAASQPRPRVRWFRLALAQPSGGAISSTSNKKYRLQSDESSLQPQSQSQSQWQRNPFKLDESQIRSSLLQVADGNLQLGAESFQRIEILAGSTSSQSANRDHLELQASRGQQQETSASANRNETWRWRQESSPGASQLETYSRLVLDKADPYYNGLYECEVVAGSTNSDQSNGMDHQSLLQSHLQLQLQGHQQRATGDQLRRLFGLLVNGPGKFNLQVTDNQIFLFKAITQQTPCQL